MKISFLPLAFALTCALHIHTAHARLIQSFGNCAELNNYYVNNVLPFVGPRGLTSTNAYTNTRSAPSTLPKVRGKPGGPAGLKRQRASDPKRIAKNNITSTLPDDPNAPDEDALEEGKDFSATNVQVKGVDEPDIIKTDGRRVYTLSENIFSVIRVQKGGANGTRTGELILPKVPTEMLFEGDYVLAIGRGFDFMRPVYQRYRSPPGSSGNEYTFVYQIRITKSGNAKLVSTLHLEGRYIKSREVDGIVRLVLQHDPLSSIWLYYPNGKVKRQQTEKWNREIIQYSEPGNWLPTYKLTRGGGVQKGVYATCSDIFYSPNSFSGFNMLTVATFPIAGKLSPSSAASILSDADKVYANAKTMYVTTSEFRYNDVRDNAARWGANYQTSIHKFALSQTGASYVASGSVTGSLINQFAISEYDDTMFIATTDGATWWSNRDLSASKITAFQTDKKKRLLKRVGNVGNLGRGERIFSVRFMRETAYVVTFREIDPLYIIDIANPRKMKVLGELKIPGFSTYLHPVGPGRLLGVGQGATLSGRTTGAKVSLFDVSDKTDPKELSVWTLKGSYSDAEWDHRAFLYWPRERVAVMPVNVLSSQKSFQGAIVLDITPEKITERGRIVHRVPGRSFTPSIKRNTIIGKVHLWSMSDDLLQINNIKNVKKVEGRVPIAFGDTEPREWTCTKSYYNTLDGCDCGCGRWDPDCNAPDQTLYCNPESSDGKTRCDRATLRCF